MIPQLQTNCDTFRQQYLSAGRRLNCYKKPAHNYYQISNFSESQLHIVQYFSTNMLWMLMDFTFMDKTPTFLDKTPIKAKIHKLISLNLAASEPQNNFIFCFQDHFSPSRIGPPSWKTLTVILVDHTARSTNFE